MELSALITALTLGLLSSLHCLGMCAGIAGALALSLPRGGPGGWGRLFSILAFNLGRLVSYGLAGALAGAFGAALVDRMTPQAGHLLLRLAGAGVLVAVGLYVAGWLPGLGRIEALGEPLWRRLEPLGRRLLPARTPAHALGYGAIWGWLPCGLVYSTLLWAGTTGGAGAGGLTMIMFGMGTLPVMLGAGLFARRLAGWMRRPGARRALGLALVVAGLLSLVYNGALAPECTVCGTP